mmetsp:Transcript_139167/g.346900  ORF Transcript_139167/g.346900 Transcript_139167/m.346900 type:complete len:331 (-) Transcript_139167:631-1623(-)
MRDILIDLHFARHVEVHKHGHLRLRFPAAEGGALPSAACDQLERPGGDLLTGGRHTDHNRDAPTTGGALERRAHDLRIACAIEGVVHTELCHAHDLRLDALPLRKVLRVDSVRGTPLLGEFQLVRQQVHRDDPRGSCLHQALDDAQAHRANPEHSRCGTPLNLGCVPDGAPTCGDATAQKADLLQRCIPADLRERLCMDHPILAEGACAHKMVDRLPLVGEARLAIARHHALAREGPDRGAEVDVWPLAELAAAAVGLVARHHVVPRRELCHALAHALHDAGSLVTQDAREETFGVRALQGVGVRVAKCHGHVLDADLALLGWADRHLYH